MARWDVQVLGVDQGRPLPVVIADVARRLGAEPSEIERLVAHAPTALVIDLDEEAAKRLVLELRTIGLRVKPRPSSAEPPPPAPTPAPTARASVAPRSIAPSEPLSVPETRAGLPADDLGGAASPRSSLEEMYEQSRASSGGTGLELEDVSPARPRLSAGVGREADSRRPGPVGAPAAPSAPSSAAPEASLAPPSRRPPPAAPSPSTSADPDGDASPRVFWSALPSAFLVPLRGPVLPGLVAAPICVGVAVLATIFGTFTAAVLVLVLMAAFLGITLQVAHRCLWATAVGERMPATLPSDFLSEYAFPGLGVMILVGIFSALTGWAAAQGLAMGAPMLVVQAGFFLYALYLVIGFALSAASRSAIGYLDVPRIVRILVRAPVPVLAIAAIGALVQGGATAIAGAQFAAVMTDEPGIGAALLAAAFAVYLVALAAAYGAALTATMMGMLFWARPDVAG